MTSGSNKKFTRPDPLIEAEVTAHVQGEESVAPPNIRQGVVNELSLRQTDPAFYAHLMRKWAARPKPEAPNAAVAKQMRQ